MMNRFGNRVRRRLGAMGALVGVLSFLCSGWAAPLILERSEDGYLSLDAREATVGSTLRALGLEFGVEIWLDPEAAELPVNLTVEDRSPQELLREMLDPLGFVVEWERFAPEASKAFERRLLWNDAWMKRLQVFRPGHRAAVRPFWGGRELVEITLADGRKVLAVKGEILLRLNPEVDARMAIAWLLANGFEVLNHHSGMGTMRVSVGDRAMDLVRALLSESGLFGYEEPHYVSSLPKSTQGSFLGSSYGSEAWLSPEAAAALSSQSRGVQVAIVDSGLNSIPGLNERVVGGFDFVEGDTDPQDSLGHGTSMAAIVGDLYGEQMRESGIENQLGLLPIRVLAEDGLTDYWTLSQAIWNVGESSADVINLSLSGTVDSELLHQAVLHAYENGKILIASAGNSGTAEVNYPAAYPEVIGVAGADARTGLVAEYSNYGDWVDVAYTGQGVIPGTDSRMISFGTSAAAARLSSTIGLLLAQEPGLGLEEIRARLRTASTPATAADGTPVSQMGILDGAALLKGGK